MSFRKRLLGTRAGVAVIVILLVAASITGVVYIGQLVSSPSIDITPSTALAGNPVSIQVVPPGPLVKGSFFTLKSISYFPDDSPSAQQQLQNVSGFSVQHVFSKSGNYTITVQYINGGSSGSITGHLTVLPSSFTTGPLHYGSAASYLGNNGTLTVTNPFGIYNMPVGAIGVGTNLSIISIAMSLTTDLTVAVSNSSMVVMDGLSLPRQVYAINSTALVSGEGYVNALLGGIGLNLSASLSLMATSTTFISIVDNSTVGQQNNLTAELSVGYLGGTLHVVPPSSTAIDSFVPAYSADRLLFSSFQNNGTFSMPAQQMNNYRSSVPVTIAMNLSGAVNGYPWMTGAYQPSLNDSRLSIRFGPMPYNTTYTIALDSVNALPASYSIRQAMDTNNTTTRLSIYLDRASLNQGGQIVRESGGQNPQGSLGNYMLWQSGPLPQLNNSTLLPFSLKSAFDYSINQTNLSAFLSENPDAFLSYASYNYSQSQWRMTFSSGSGSAYSLNVTKTGSTATSAPSFTALSPVMPSPFGSSVLTVGSAADIAANCQYSSYFLNKSGNISLSALTFQLQLPYQPAISPFLPPPVHYAAFAYLLTSTAGEVLAIDATNGQLIYMVTGFAQALIP